MAKVAGEEEEKNAGLEEKEDVESCAHDAGLRAKYRRYRCR